MTEHGRILHLGIRLNPTRLRTRPSVRSEYAWDNSIVNVYGRVEGTVSFDNAENGNELFKSFYPNGENLPNYFSIVKKNMIKRVVRMSAIDLGNIVINNSNDPLCDTKYADIWTRVHVTSKPHGLKDDIFYVTKMEIPINNPLKTKLTLSDKESLISSVDSVKGATYSGATNYHLTTS